MYFNVLVDKDGGIAFISDHQPEDMIRAISVDHETGLCELEYMNKNEPMSFEVNLCDDILKAIEAHDSGIFAYFDKNLETFHDIYYIGINHENIEMRRAEH